MLTGSDIAYFDASALHKLVVGEPESEALRKAARAWPRRVTSRLAIVELIRSVRRADPALEPAATRLLAHVSLLVDTNRVLVAATQLEPQTLRALDAIHVTTALRVEIRSRRLRELRPAPARGGGSARPTGRLAALTQIRSGTTPSASSACMAASCSAAFFVEPRPMPS